MWEVSAVGYEADQKDQRFAQMVEKHQEAVKRMCFLCLCDRTLAEDARRTGTASAWRDML